jgi:hypothetical protein
MVDFIPPDSSGGWPTRAAVDRIWSALVLGEVDRETVHAWTISWVEGTPDYEGAEGGVDTALHYLHGFDLVDPGRPGDRTIQHGPPGTYVASTKDIEDELRKWRKSYEDFLRDPEAWKTRQRQFRIP